MNSKRQEAFKLKVCDIVRYSVKTEIESNASKTEKDECQLFVKPNLLEFKTFTSKEDAQEFINNWDGEQLSSIGNGKTWYVCLPNIISEAIEYGIKETEKILKLNVSLGYEWTTGRTWFDCH